MREHLFNIKNVLKLVNFPQCKDIWKIQFFTKEIYKTRKFKFETSFMFLAYHHKRSYVNSFNRKENYHFSENAKTPKFQKTIHSDSFVVSCKICNNVFKSFVSFTPSRACKKLSFLEVLGNLGRKANFFTLFRIPKISFLDIQIFFLKKAY